MKRKSTATKRGLFSRKASIVWEDLARLNLSRKPVVKWTIKDKESFVKAINKYPCITDKDDPGMDCGDLYDIVERVNRHLLDGYDDDMLRWLDPDYVVVDWTNAQQQLPAPNLSMVEPPLSATFPIVNTVQPNCYIVPSREDGDCLLGLVNERWPGAIGFVTSSPSPLVFRGS